VCYSFWMFFVLLILNKLGYIDSEKLIAFILSAQGLKGGGITNKLGNMDDVVHTLFDVASAFFACDKPISFTPLY
ncbi:hypothetical protein P691DRAFT_622184, partial [Macrolepiota fuliginosa MF-IS2]